MIFGNNKSLVLDHLLCMHLQVAPDAGHHGRRPAVQGGEDPVNDLLLQQSVARPLLQAEVDDIDNFNAEADAQLIKECAVYLVKAPALASGIGSSGPPTPSQAVDLVIEALEQRTEVDADAVEGLGFATTARKRFAGYTAKVREHLAAAVAAATTPHHRKGNHCQGGRGKAICRIEEEHTDLDKSARLAEVKRTQSRTQSGVSVPDEHVYKAALAAGATNANNAAAYQRRLRTLLRSSR